MATVETHLTGDDAAFRGLVEGHRSALLAHCYRMLGSLHDAEDAPQETLLRAWRGLPGLTNRAALRTWLYRIATNVCLDAIARRPKRVLPIDYGPPNPDGAWDAAGPLDASMWIEPYPDAELGDDDGLASPLARYERREAIELAFIAALQHLTARQRAVLILRDVLGFSAREVAGTLETSVAAANGALQRARATLGARLPDRSQQATLRRLGDARGRELVERFSAAFERGDVEAILALLAADVTFSMPPYPDWCRGREAVAESWLMPEGPGPRLRYAPVRANGQLAVGCYALDRRAGAYVPIALDVLTVGEAGITAVIAFRSPGLLERFGMPARLAAT